jgi:heptosyltransferase I
MPVLRLLRIHFPHAEIHWWITDSLAGLLEGDPDLDGLYRFDRKTWGRPTSWASAWRGLIRMRRAGYDWVIDLQSLLRSGVVSWLARGGLCVGLEDPREGAAAFHDISVPRPSFGTHAVDWYQSVLLRLRVPVDRPFEWIPRREAAVGMIRSRWPVDGGRWIGLQPGARWENKRWPLEHFVLLARRLIDHDPGLRIAVFGSGEDSELGNAILRTLGREHLNLTGQTKLPETIEWLRLCEVLVTNDTGPMHIASALGTPVIALFGPTDPRRTGPYGQERNVMRVSLECAPCMRSVCRHHEPVACLTRLDVESVAARVIRGLKPANTKARL